VRGSKLRISVIIPGSFLPEAYAIGIASYEATTRSRMTRMPGWSLLAGSAERYCATFRPERAEHKAPRDECGRRNAQGLDRHEKWRGELSDLGGGLYLWSLQGDCRDFSFLRWDSDQVCAVRSELERRGVSLAGPQVTAAMDTAVPCL